MFQADDVPADDDPEDDDDQVGDPRHLGVNICVLLTVCNEDKSHF